MVFDIDLAENDLVAVRVAYDAFCCGNGSKLSLMLRDTCGLIYDMDSCLEVYGSYGRLFVGWSVQDKRLFDSLDIFFEQLRAFKRGITIIKTVYMLICHKAPTEFPIIIKAPLMAIAALACHCKFRIFLFQIGLSSPFF